MSDAIQQTRPAPDVEHIADTGGENGRRAAQLGVAATAGLSDATLPGPLPDPRKGLFIIGAARSGTTILQNALNDSPDIYLFGEPNFHIDADTPDFARRFNAMHGYWGMQPTKSSYCPPVLPAGAGWRETLAWMARQHRHVGAKIVINPVRTADWLEQLSSFHCQNFYSSRYIFTFRDPVATITSTHELQILLMGKAEDITTMLRSYVDTISFFIRMLRTLPHVTALCHEDIDQQTFTQLGAWLGTDLSRSHLYYQAERVRRYQLVDMDASIQARMEPICALYAQLRQEARAGFTTPQLDQNNNHFNPNHFTPLGRLARSAAAIAETLPLVTTTLPPKQYI